MKAMVAGASGLIGSHLLKILSEDDTVQEVYALVRTEGSMPRLPGVHELKVDFSNLQIDSDKFQSSHVFCALGTTIKKAGSQAKFRKVDFEYPLRLAKLAADAKARSFHIVTALGADANSSIFYNRVKGEVEAELKKINFPAMNIYRPSLLLGERSESRPGEDIGKIVAPAFNLFLHGPLKKYRAINAETVARAMLNQAKRSEPGVRIIESDEISQIGK